jgi:hypothetical protein
VSPCDSDGGRSSAAKIISLDHSGHCCCLLEIRILSAGNPVR